MESYLNGLLVIVSLSSFFFFNSAEAICVSRNSTHHPGTPIKPKPSSPPPIVINSKVGQICNNTDYPDLCLSSLKNYLNGKTDLVTILGDEIKACKNKTVNLIVLAEKESQDPKASEDTKSIAEDCKEAFIDALDNLENAETAVKDSDIGTANSMLSAAYTDAGDCDDESSGDPDLGNLLSREDLTLRQLVSNSLAIASMVTL